jgi:hypothetical protein
VGATIPCDSGDVDEPFEPLAGLTLYWLVLKIRDPTWAPGELAELDHPQTRRTQRSGQKTPQPKIRRFTGLT